MGKKKLLKGSISLLLSALIVSSGAAVLAANAEEVITGNPYDVSALPGADDEIEALTVEFDTVQNNDIIPIRGDTVTLLAQAAGGRERYEYQFVLNYQDKDGNETTTEIQDFKPGNSFEYTFTENGTYNFTVTVRDGYDTKVSATKTIKIVEGHFVFAYANPSAPNVNEEVTFNSMAVGIGNHPYITRYTITDPEGSIETIDAPETGTTDNGAATWTPTKAGTYQVKVSAIWNDMEYAAKTFTVEVQDPDDALEMTLEADETTVAIGQTATINVFAKGGSGQYNVNCVRCEFQGGYADKPQKVSDTEYVLSPTKSGPYEVFFEVTDSKGKTVNDSIIIIGDNAYIHSFKTDKTEVSVGETVTITSTATGYADRSIVKNTVSDGTTTKSLVVTNPKVHTYSSAWTPDKAGTYTVTNELYYNNKLLETQSTTVTVKGSGEEVTPVSNGTVTIYYKGYAAPKIEYQTDSEEWSEPVAMKRITTEFGATHKYTIDLGSAKGTVVRFSNGKGGVDDLDGQNYSFTKGLYFYNNGVISSVTGQTMLKNNTLVSNPTLPTKNDINVTGVVLGESLKVKCAATGGTGNYEYAVLYRKITSAKWSTLQDFSANNIVNVKPATVGKYVICVKTRDGSGILQKKYFVINVVEEMKLVVNLSDTTLKLGDAATVNCDAAGGSGRFIYGVWYKKSSKDQYYTVRKYNSNGTISVKPSAATEYDIRVKAKDLVTGQLIIQDYTILVKK